MPNNSSSTKAQSSPRFPPKIEVSAGRSTVAETETGEGIAPKLIWLLAMAELPAGEDWFSFSLLLVVFIVSSWDTESVDEILAGRH